MCSSDLSYSVCGFLFVSELWPVATLLVTDDRRERERYTERNRADKMTGSQLRSLMIIER